MFYLRRCVTCPDDGVGRRGDNGVTGEWSVRWRCRGCYPLLRRPAALDNEQREFDSLNRFSGHRDLAVRMAA